MDDRQWAAFAAELDHVFQGDFGPSGPDDTSGRLQEEAYRRHLGGESYDVATSAIALLLEDGKLWLPKVGELRAAMRRVTTRAAMPFAEAWPIVSRLVRRHTPHPALSPASRQDRLTLLVQEVVEQVGEGAARWVESRGFAGFGREQVDHPEHGGAVLARLEREYLEFCEQSEEDGKVGVALERVGRRELRRAQGPRRLAPASAGELGPAS